MGNLHLVRRLVPAGSRTERCGRDFKAFANAVDSQLGGYGWQALFAIDGTIVIYFYAHYAFASITAHMLSMFPAFLAVLLMKGAPIGLAVWTFACSANLSACSTHYGTTPAPVYFAQD